MRTNLNTKEGPGFDNMVLSFFPGNRGNIFISPHVNETFFDEGWEYTNKEHILYDIEANKIIDFTNYGKILMILAANAITGGIDNSLANQKSDEFIELPDTFNLVTNGDKVLGDIVNEAEHIGDELYNKMKQLRFEKASKEFLEKMEHPNTHPSSVIIKRSNRPTLVQKEKS